MDVRDIPVEIAESLAPSVRQFGPTVAEFDGRLLDVYGEGPGWIVALELPARRALAAFHEHCLREGVEFRPRQFYAATPANAASTGFLTREYDTLALAYERGYFDTPRGISQNELADALGVSQTVISRRLRSAVGRIVGEAVARRGEK